MTIADDYTAAGRHSGSIRKVLTGAVAAVTFAAAVAVAVISPTAALGATPVVPTAAAEGTPTTYGPDGTHWPQNTPRADAARVVDVAPSWAAISAAISANAASADPVVICVAPGVIEGGEGSSSSSNGVLQGIGNAARASRILVTACDGVGTVKVGAGSGVAFVGVNGVSIVGIDFSAQSLMIRNSESFAVGYSKVPRLLVTANGGNGIRNVEVIEIVAGPEAANGAEYDRAEVKSADGYSVDGLRFAGFYAAPNYQPAGSSAHTDTLQFVTTSGNGTISNVFIEDSVLFQSTNQGIMAGDNRGGAITHSAFFGGTTGQLRYPMYPGGDTIRYSNLLHGTWSGLTVADSIVAGSINSNFTFSDVTNSSSNKGQSGFTQLGELTLADIDRLAPMPTDERLAAVWSSATTGGGVPPVVAPGPVVPVPPVVEPGPVVPAPPVVEPDPVVPSPIPDPEVTPNPDPEDPDQAEEPTMWFWDFWAIIWERWLDSNLRFGR